MSKRRMWLVAAVLVAGVSMGAIGLGMQMDGRGTPGSLAYQGQNTGVFQMFFSPFTRQDSFLLNSAVGRVWVLKSAGDRNEFEPVAVSPAPAASNQPGRFRVYFGATVRADTFLIDTQSGQLWTLISDQQTGLPFFSGTAVK